MNRLVVPSLLALTTVALGCGPRGQSTDSERKKTSDGPPMVAQLEVKLQSGIALTFRVTNNEPRKIELLFPSGQTHDFIVLDSIGREMWRWSEGRMFTQVVQNRVLDASASLGWEADVRSDLPPGQYTAVARLLSENRPVEQRVAFEVRGLD